MQQGAGAPIWLEAVFEEGLVPQMWVGLVWLVGGCKKPLLMCEPGALVGGKEHAGPGGPKGAGCI